MRQLLIAIPAMDEMNFLPQTLNSLLSEHVSSSLKVYICVNQPDIWWNEADKQEIVSANMDTIRYIENLHDDRVILLDYASKGKGWKEKKSGVGIARKTLMDSILKNADNDDIFLSMDADTIVEEGYLSAVENLFDHQEIKVLSVPYYHPLVQNEAQNRSMLRYEIYLRNYLIHLIKICSPYSFTALGSAIACRISACKSAGGFDSRQSGEDFYFLQRLAKSTNINLYLDKKVFPANRLSDRVPYGTGKAIENGVNGQLDKYPVFSPQVFEKVKETYMLIDDLYQQDIDTEMITFMKHHFCDENFLQPLRNNSTSKSQFRKAFHQKIDALRIFQFLRAEQAKMATTDEENLKTTIETYFPDVGEKSLLANLSFQHSSIATLNKIRNFMFQKEQQLRYNFDKNRQNGSI